MHLARYPRRFYAHLPTPLEPLPRFSSALGGPNIWIKRDDCTGLAGGGNKTRKLEFLLGEALAQNSDIIITQGAIQSNHARQTAAAAAREGLECHLLLEDRTLSEDTDYLYNGNVMMDSLLGATLHYRKQGTDMQQAMELLADEMRAQGRSPYVMKGGGSNHVGALGYVNAAIELVNQCNNLDLHIQQLVHATGSGGTQAGLVAGMVGLNSHIPVLGVGVRAPAPQQKANVMREAQATLHHLDIDHTLREDDVLVNCDYVGEGYGIPNAGTLEAIELLAKTEGIFLDPVYSGKGMAGLIDLIRKGYYQPEDNIVFLHTGGAQALPGYRSAFAFGDYLIGVERGAAD